MVQALLGCKQIGMALPYARRRHSNHCLLPSGGQGNSVAVADDRAGTGATLEDYLGLCNTCSRIGALVAANAPTFTMLNWRLSCDPLIHLVFILFRRLGNGDHFALFS